ncbi:ALG12 family protein [Megaselia abdita]
MSRTLPNILVLPIVLLALTAWFKKENNRFIWLSGVSILIFRSELSILFGLLLLHNLFCNQIKFKSFLHTTIIAAFAILSITICIDSFFWNKLIWPEGKVLWYNTILNKSSEWGTSPFLWYFYSALPRAMGFSAIFVPFGLYLERRIRALCLISLMFVLLYSFLPHKELRFIIYVFPVLNVSSACYCSAIWKNYQKSALNRLKAVVCVGHIFLNFGFTMFLLLVSSVNYPGGEAIQKLNSIDSSPNQYVHVSNLVAQSGLTRFYQRGNWIYNKTENLKYNAESTLAFDYLLVEQNSKSLDEINSLQMNFIQIDQVYCFNKISIQYKYFNPVSIDMKPCVIILKRKTQIFKREPDYEGLRRLAIENIKEFRNSKIMWRIVEEYHNSRLSKSKINKNTSVKANEKQDEIKLLIDKISKLDLSEYCDLEKIDIKECLKTVIDVVEG